MFIKRIYVKHSIKTPFTYPIWRWFLVFAFFHNHTMWNILTNCMKKPICWSFLCLRNYRNPLEGRFPFRVFSCAGGKFLQKKESARIFFKEPIRFHAKKQCRKNTRNGKRPWHVTLKCRTQPFHHEKFNFKSITRCWTLTGPLYWQG